MFSGGGHYTAYGRNELTGRWYYFDDSCVSPVRNPEDVVCKGAYLLIYLRRSDEKIFHDIQNRMKTAITDLVTHSGDASASSSQGSSSHSYNLRQRGSSPATSYGHSGPGNTNSPFGGLSSLISTASSVSSSKTAKPASPQQTLASSTSVGGLSSPSQKPSQAIPIAGGRTGRSPFNGQDGDSGPDPMDQVD